MTKAELNELVEHIIRIRDINDFTRQERKDLADVCNIIYDNIDILQEEAPESGKWIVDAPHYICSECNYVHHLQRLEVMSGCKLGNYCPNCGAKMVEPQERSDKE